jgi:hypothetical protein
MIKAKHAENDQENGHNNHKPRLDQFRRFRDDPVA